MFWLWFLGIMVLVFFGAAVWLAAEVYRREDEDT